jgi:hypothetical protein
MREQLVVHATLRTKVKESASPCNLYRRSAIGVGPGAGSWAFVAILKKPLSTSNPRPLHRTPIVLHGGALSFILVRGVACTTKCPVNFRLIFECYFFKARPESL